MADSSKVDIFDRLKDLRTKLKPYDTKKDLLRASKHIQKEYAVFRIYLGIDKRLAPKRVRKELNKYKKTALKIKSHYLKINLTKVSGFDRFDKYRSSSKLIAKVTDSMITEGNTLSQIDVVNRSIEISYKNTRNRKVIDFTLDEIGNLEFMDNLPTTVYINIGDTAYNKNGLDFIHDYHNMSQDFINNLLPYINNQELHIYTQ